MTHYTLDDNDASDYDINDARRHDELRRRLRTLSVDVYHPEGFLIRATTEEKI